MRLTVVLAIALALAAPAAALELPLPAAAPRAPGLGPLDAPAADDAAARALVAALPRATRANDADGNKLFDDLDREFRAALPGARLPVIVVARDGSDPRAVLAEARAAAGRDFEPHRVFTLVPGFAARLGAEEALGVAALPAVRQLEWSRPGAPDLATAKLVEGVVAVQEGLGVTGDVDGLPTFSAQDVTIAVLDTGFDGEHLDLGEGKIIHFEDIAEGKNGEAYDSANHGTHVASIAAGLGRGDAALSGVAPGAPILGVKIAGGTDVLADTIAGVEYVVAHKDHFGVRVLTLSFGFGRATDGTTALELAMDKAWDAGIVCFKSAGNSGSERQTITVPGAARGIMATGAILDPAGFQGGLLAGAPVEAPTPLDPAFANFGFQLAPFSSRGPTTDGRVKPDLVAPGWSIEAASAGSKDGYVALSGTSMASPFAAGAAALVIAANPALTPDQVREVMKGTAEDWGIQGPDVDYGAGRLDVLAAVGRALALRGADVPAVDPPVVPKHESRAGTFPGGTVPAPGAVPALAVATQTIEVNETGRPLALTLIVEGKTIGVVVKDPSGGVVLDTTLAGINPGDRQISLGFNATAAGVYEVSLVGVPTTPYSLDIAWDATIAPSLLALLPESPLEGLQGAAAEDPKVDVPGATAALVLGALGAAAAVAARRRGR